MLLDGIRTIDSFDPDGKKVLLRVDLNSPVNRDSLDIESSVKVEAATVSIKELVSRGAAVAVLAHQGRPGDYDFISLAKHARIMERSMGGGLEFVGDVCGTDAERAIEGLQPGKALLLDNVRRLDYEQKKGSAEEHSKTELVSRLSPHFDYFVNDAFAAIHRPHCSMVGFTATLPSAAGRLMEKELSHLSNLLDNPRRPAVYAFGGRKFADFMPVLGSVARNEKVDSILLSGYLAISFLMAQGTRVDEATAQNIREESTKGFFEEAGRLLEENHKIKLPLDMGFEIDGKRKDAAIAEWPEKGKALDIGRKTIEEYTGIISSSGTVFISGPPGMYEKEDFSLGTRSVFEASTGTGIYSVIGGGHTSAAAKQLGYSSRVSYMSTGGGALEALITGKKLDVLDALRESGKKFAGRFK